jgi:hypothetical protein
LVAEITFQITGQPSSLQSDFYAPLLLQTLSTMLVDWNANVVPSYVVQGSLHIDAAPPVHDVAVTSVACSKTVVGTGFMVIGTPFSDNVTVLVADTGDYAEIFNVTAYANSTVIGTQQVNLNASDNATLTFGWNTTTGLAYGSYKLSAYAWPVLGETNTADNNCTGGVVTVTIPGDINGDFKINLEDLTTLGMAYGSHCANHDYQGEPASPNWNPNADIDGNGVVRLTDITIMAYNWGQTAH